MFIWVLQRWIIDGRNRAAARAAFLDEAKPLFSNGTKRIVETGLPRMAGTYRGHVFDLQVAPDALNYRKLPALWVLVTLTEEQPVAATVDLMMRPRGVEEFSSFSTLPVQIEPPPGFPSDCAIRTDSRAALPDLTIMQRHAALFSDPLHKELIVSPKGLRLVLLAEEANRTRYLLFRDSEMGVRPIPATRLQAAMDRLIDLADDLSQQSSLRQAV